VDPSTIAAVASPPGPGRRGILRLSGPAARAIANRALAAPGALEPIPAGAARRGFRATFGDGVGRQPALVLWMPGPGSYTGEDVVELHLPGAPPLLARALGRLLELGARAATPGEFTRRAFLNGRMDLSEVEGVLALVRSTSAAEQRSALRLLDGGLQRRVRGLRDELDDVRALCEASLDFDEDDAGHVPLEELAARLDAIGERLADARAVEAVRQPPAALPRVALAGAPNAGKSSLWNALVEGGRALVSEEPGTTRDVLVGTAGVGRAEVLLVDLAGEDPAAYGPDAEAQRQARVERESAALVLWVVEAERLAGPERARVLAEAPSEEPGENGARVLGILSKVDRFAPEAAARLAADVAVATGSGPWLATSARTGSGIAELRGRIAELVGLGGDARGELDLSREVFLRHRAALERAEAFARRARRGLGELPLDVSAETLREASAALDEIFGRTTSEDLLDRIFARFCLGK
jgi:tRNA modification GTPase